MACFEHGTIIELDARDVVKLPDVRSATLRVARGTLWITQEGDPQDIVLRAGDTWVVERDGLTIVEAQGDAIFGVTGRRLETLEAGHARGVPSTSAWSWTRDAIAAFFASPTRGAIPYV
jgi:hypothetical protein